MSSQVREAFEVLISQMEDPPSWDELNSTQTSSPQPPKRFWRGPVVALAAAIVTLVVVGLVGLIRTNSETATESMEWSELEPWPLERRSDFSQVWTGSELIVWGGLKEDTPNSFDNGARYDLASDTWTTLSESPLFPRSRLVGVWTGSEVIYWGGIAGDGDEPETVTALSDGAAYDPETGLWRLLSESPLDGGSTYAGVWTGQNVVFVGPDEEKNAAYDPSSDSWALLPPRPPQGHPTDWISAFWTGDEVVVVTSDASQADVFVYNPETNTWRAMPPSPFDTMDLSVSPGAPTHAISGSMLWLSGFSPQDNGVAGVNVDTGEWVVSPPFPGNDCTDIPSAVTTDKGPLFESCGVTAILSEGAWEEMPTLPRTLPKHPGPDPVWTGDALLLLEAGIESGTANFPDGSPPHLWKLATKTDDRT